MDKKIFSKGIATKPKKESKAIIGTCNPNLKQILATRKCFKASFTFQWFFLKEKPTSKEICNRAEMYLQQRKYSITLRILDNQIFSMGYDRS